jgi:phosphoribosylglycinamide formyltransferase-1
MDVTALRPVPTGILISGRGTNMVALVRAAREGRLAADVRVVVSNRADAPGLAKAAELGVATEVLAHGAFPTREAFDEALAGLLVRHGVEFVALAGFLRVLTPGFLRRFPGGVVNIHPSLLPSFPGAHAHRDALAHGVKVSGCTVHFVDEGTDTGPIVAQVAVPVLPGDTEQSLSDRILACENRLFPEALAPILRALAASRRGRT